MNWSEDALIKHIEQQEEIRKLKEEIKYWREQAAFYRSLIEDKR